MVPPAASIALTADALNLWAEMETLAVNSPRPKILIKSFLEAKPF